MKGSPVSSKLLKCIEIWNLDISGTNPADTRACSHSQYSDPAMIVFC